MKQYLCLNKKCNHVLESDHTLNGRYLLCPNCRKPMVITIKSFEPEELPNIGWISITEIGEENMYFQYKINNKYYDGCCKVEGFSI